MRSCAQAASRHVFLTLSKTHNGIPEVLVELVQESRALFLASYGDGGAAFQRWKSQVAVGKRNFHFSITYYISNAFKCMSKGWFTAVRSFLIAREVLLAFLCFFKNGDALVEHFYYPWGSDELDITAALTAIHQLLDPHWDWILPLSGVHFNVPQIVFPFPPTDISEYVMVDTDFSWNNLFKVSTKVNPPVQASHPETPSELDLDWFTKYVAETHAAHPTLQGFMQKIFDDYIHSKRCTFELPYLKNLPVDCYFRGQREWDNAAWMGDALGYKIVDDTLYRNHADADPRFHSSCTRVLAENKNLTSLLRARGYIHDDQPMENHDGGTQEEAYLFLTWETSWKENPKKMVVWSEDNVEPIILNMELAFVAREEILRWEKFDEDLRLAFPRLLTYEEWKLEEEIDAYSPREPPSSPTVLSPEHLSELEQVPSPFPKIYEGFVFQTTESSLTKSPSRLESRSSSSSSSFHSSDNYFSAGSSCSSPQGLQHSPPLTLRKSRNCEEGVEKENIPPFNTRAASSTWGPQYHPYRRHRY